MAVPSARNLYGFEGAGVGDDGDDGVDGDNGVIGDALGPLPVVLLGDIDPVALPVVAAGEGALLAVFLLLFQPAIRMIAIKTTTAMPAIQPHIPPSVSGRRLTGSLKRSS